MKQYFIGALLGVAALVNINEAKAQTDVRFGVKGGLNLAHGTEKIVNPIDNQTSKFGYFGPGFYAGGLMEFSFPKGSLWKLQAEALFNYNTLRANDLDATLRLGTVSIPVMAKYFPKPNFGLMAGVSANFNVMGKVADRSLDVVRNLNDLKTFQTGLLFGMNYYVKKGFFLDARYTYNLGNIAEPAHDENKFTYGTISVGIGYKFR